MNTRRKLVLFDIDGTLLHCGRIWYESFLGAVQDAFPAQNLPKISFSGKTDPLIVREMLQGMEISCATDLESSELARWTHDILTDYLSRVKAHRDTRVLEEVRIFPGVLELINELHSRPDVILSTLTGNWIEGAKLKLWSAGLHTKIDTEHGAFGSDHWDRTQLPGVAVQRAYEKSGYHFQNKDIVILGDTIHDVRCGRALNVKSIAVGTGHNADESVLRSENPDHYFADFSDTQKVIEAVLSD